jgi:periplasmic mercuric ion binding protein
MKTIKLINAILLMATLGITSYAQSNNNSKTLTTKTETIKVMGNCDLCKARIEKAAKIDGVSKADWNDESKILTLVYNPSKVNSDDVQKKIAAAGHDTEKFKADDKAYNSIPGCCKYR